MENKLGPYLTINQAAKMAGVQRATIIGYIKRGYLKTHFLGEMVYYRDVLRAALLSQQNSMTGGRK